MMKYLVPLIMLTSCDLCENKSPEHCTKEPENMTGCAYQDSFKASVMAKDLTVMACEWPDSYPGSEEDGAAYIDSQNAAEDADCHED